MPCPKGGELLFDCQNFVADENFCKTVTDLEPGNYVRMSVSDTGTGIPKEVQKKIFEPFFTTKEVGKGTGLGLSMVYGIMQNHHGTITVDSKESKGATFSLYFPAIKGKTTAESADVSQEMTTSISINQTILIVDDDAEMRELAKDILEPRGAKVYFAGDGEEAFDVYQAHKDEIDLIVLDLIMPKRDGMTVFTEVREVNPNVKVIFSSGYAEGAEITQLRQQGAVEFIQKPFREEQLINKIRNVTVLAP